MSWADRESWVNEFSRVTGAVWFENIKGILQYFANDPIFGSSAWASYSDAGVLFVIMDGYNQSTGLASACAVGGVLCTTASGSWMTFFANLPNGNPSASYQDWANAEQNGVDYGVSIASGLRNNVGAAERAQIDVFVGFGNAYRSMLSQGLGPLVNTVTNPIYGGGIMDPSSPASGSFVRGISEDAVNPLATNLAIVYHVQERRPLLVGPPIRMK